MERIEEQKMQFPLNQRFTLTLKEAGCISILEKRNFGEWQRNTLVQNS